MRVKSKTKRAAILAVIIYIMINGLVWGFMKAYVNSYNAVNHEKLVMAQISDKSGGKEIKIIDNLFFISEINSYSHVQSAFYSLLPVEVKTVAKVFKRSAQEIVQLLQK